MKKFFRNLSHVQIIALGFVILLLAGTLLLMLPVARQDHQSASFSDALFTATSAGCVTGLVTVDTGTTWSVFGQCVILVLIQIGGLGVITIATLFFLLFRRRMGLRQKEVMSESINSSGIGNIRRIAGDIFRGTIVLEGCGAVILALRFYFGYGFSLPRAFFVGLFCAVSAFCNAGFDLNGSFSSFQEYSADPVIMPVLIALIIIGGIGFLVWEEIREKKFRFRLYSLHAKIALITTLILTLGGALVFFFLERNYSHAGQSLPHAILSSIFDATTPRTAGFSISDMSRFSTGGMLLTMVLMFIGGSPGSTAGGIKTTTIAVLFLFSFASMRSSHSAGAFRRRLPRESLSKAAGVFFVNLTLVLTSFFLLSVFQPNFSFTDLIFEAFSAMGTVGMSTGITPYLNTGARIVLILLMFVGRVGSISFGAALMEKKAPPPAMDPYENVIVG